MNFLEYFAIHTTECNTNVVSTFCIINTQHPCLCASKIWFIFQDHYHSINCNDPSSVSSALSLLFTWCSSITLLLLIKSFIRYNKSRLAQSQINCFSITQSCITNNSMCQNVNKALHAMRSVLVIGRCKITTTMNSWPISPTG